ncbi:MAG: M20/M25/M40 family metallo-hydrolase [Acidobacteria bacterium]|nr:M20/M25/M40 family metallo-hydrolase [Acidobacteriota bacterium]
MRACGVGVMIALVCGGAVAQGPTLPAKDKVLARQIFKEFIETNSQDSNGSVTAVAEAARKELLANGFAADDLILAGPNDRKQNLVVRYKGAANSKLKPILIIGHIDVVEARRSDWTTDPYQFVEKDGYFYGRGTQDMKDGDADVVASFIRLRREGYVPDRDITLALTADEEGGKSNGVSWLLKNRPELMKAEFVINPDGAGPTLRDGKAVEMDVEATEKTYADYRVIATNPGGHSSEPRPDNAIYELVHALERLEASPFPVELNAVSRASLEESEKVTTPERAADIRGVLKTPPDPKAVADFSKNAQDSAILRTTCVATMLKGGHAPNALPGEAEANVNCRILPGHSQEEVRQDLIKIFNDPKLTVEYMADDGTVSATAPNRESQAPPPLRPDVFVPLRAVTAQLWPGMPVIPSMSVGASDSIYTMQEGIPSYGIGGAGIEFGDDRMHGRDERIGVDSFYKSVEFFYLYLKALTSKPVA